MIDKYGETIEADLHRYYTIDLLDFFHGRYSWRKFEVLLDRLPWDSAYNLAITDDDELAESYLSKMDDIELFDDDEERGSQQRRIPLTQWDHWSELRASIMDGLMLVVRTLVMVNTPKGRQVPPPHFQPRPETAIVRVRRQKRDAIMDDLERQLSGLNSRLDLTEEGAHHDGSLSGRGGVPPGNTIPHEVAQEDQD